MVTKKIILLLIVLSIIMPCLNSEDEKERAGVRRQFRRNTKTRSENTGRNGNTGRNENTGRNGNTGRIGDAGSAHGNTLEYTFKEPGSYNFSVKGYPKMEMTITVK